MQKFALLFLAFLAACHSAEAQLIPLPPELKAFLMRPEQQQGFIGSMARQWHTIIPNCASPQVKSTNVFIDSSPTFDQAGVPTSGAWHVASQVEGCGEIRTITVFYFFAKDGEMKRITGLPGTTIADSTLQRDALPYAIMSMAGIAPKNCNSTLFTNTRFVGFEQTSPQATPGPIKRAWTEEWTVWSCGVTGIVAVHFTPDATGTGITSIMNETRRVNP